MAWAETYEMLEIHIVTKVKKELNNLFHILLTSRKYYPDPRIYNLDNFLPEISSFSASSILVIENKPPFLRCNQVAQTKKSLSQLLYYPRLDNIITSLDTKTIQYLIQPHLSISESTPKPQVCLVKRSAPEIPTCLFL